MNLADLENHLMTTPYTFFVAPIQSKSIPLLTKAFQLKSQSKPKPKVLNQIFLLLSALLHKMQRECRPITNMCNQEYYIDQCNAVNAIKEK